jgi:hypothetical protein
MFNKTMLHKVGDADGTIMCQTNFLLPPNCYMIVIMVALFSIQACVNRYFLSEQISMERNSSCG